MKFLDWTLLAGALCLLSYIVLAAPGRPPVYGLDVGKQVETLMIGAGLKMYPAAERVAATLPDRGKDLESKVRSIVAAYKRWLKVKPGYLELEAELELGELLGAEIDPSVAPGAAPAPTSLRKPNVAAG
jgi:hypothetical protein